VIRKALGFAFFYTFGIGTALVAVALALPAPPPETVGDVQHALLATDPGVAAPAVGACPYLAAQAAATACPYLARQSAMESCPYLSGRTGSGCPALGGAGSTCPRAGRSPDAPAPVDRSGRGALLAELASEPVPAAAAHSA